MKEKTLGCLCKWGWVALLFLVMSTANSFAQVPMAINYQGYLLDSEGYPIQGTVSITFGIYDDPEGGTLHWSETHSAVDVEAGVFNLILGTSVPITAGILDGDRYLGITVETDSEMVPRARLTSGAYAIRAGYAENVADAAVTADKIASAAVTGEKVAEKALTAFHLQDGSGSSLNADFLDGYNSSAFSLSNHDHDGAYVTAVNAGTGLSGGGISGDLTLNVAVPLSLTGSSTADTGIIKGANTGNGYGLYGSSGNNYGVLGNSVSVAGVAGYSGSGPGVVGLNGNGGNEGQLGTSNVGVYGKGMTSSSVGVYGIHNDNNNVGVLGRLNDGVYGLSNTIGGSGIAGIHNSSGNGVYGRSVSGYAGNFEGNVHASGEMTISGNVKTSSNFQYSSPKTFYLSIPACAFQKDEWYEVTSGVFWCQSGNGEYGYICEGPLYPSVNIYAPLHLPQGAVITKVTFYYYDNDSLRSVRLQARLFRRPYTTPSCYSLAWVSAISGNSTAVQSATTDDFTETVDNENEQYWLSVNLNVDYATVSDQLRFYGAKLEYFISALAP